MNFNFPKAEVSCPVFDIKKHSDRTLRSLVYFNPSLVSECLTTKLVDANQNEIQCISSDIALLLRMQNGHKIDSALAEELLNRLSSGINDSLKEVFDNASDEELLDSVRSKYIQTPAQLEDYLRGLDSRLENLSSQELQAVVESSGIVDDKSVAESSSSE